MLLSILILFIGITIYKTRNRWEPISNSLINKNKMMVIGHRGSPLEEPENTVKSFIKAVQAKIDGVELDIQLTRDKKIVVYHDWHYTDKSNKKNLIKDLNFSEIREVPLLKDVLDVIPKKFIKIIEIKSKQISNSGIEKQLIDLILSYNIINSCIISSFNPFVIRRVKILNPEVETALLWSLDKPLFMLNSPLWVWFCKPDGFHADIKFLNDDLAIWVKKKQMHLYAYTIINCNQLIKSKKMKINGIIVDDPYLNFK